MASARRSPTTGSPSVECAKTTQPGGGEANDALKCGPAYTCVYAAHWSEIVPRTAKIFMNNRSQAVRLPKEFQFDTTEVFIRKVGDEVVLSPRPEDWSAYLAGGPVASAEFMEGVEDLPVQEREA